MSQPDALSEIRFSVIGVKTVNDCQSNADVVEVACVKIQGLRIAETLHMQINPAMALPEEFTRTTGIYTASLQDKPTLDAVLDELAAFVGRDVIIWANAPGKINAVHRYFKLTQPLDRQFFLFNLSQKALPVLSRHTLPILAAHFGLETDGLARAEMTAIIAAKVFLNLMEVIQKEGIATFSQLLDFCPRVPVRLHRTRDDLAFDRHRLKDYPTLPGVYFMKNRAGEILYVGKAKSLRNRLKSYFQKQSGLPPKIALMMRQVARIDVSVVGSELEALLLEARLIKHHQPFFNKKIKDYQRMVFMGLSVHERFPKVSVHPETDDPDMAYFGPFHGRSMLKTQQELFNRVFQLRDCSEQKFQAHRHSPCMQFQLGMCSGPCAEKISESDYRERVADFMRYLAQQPCNAVDGLTARRDAYIEALMFEKAAQVQEQLEMLAHLQRTSHRLIQAVERHHCLILLPDVAPGFFRLLSVIQGQPSQWKTINPSTLDWAEMTRWIQTELDAVPLTETGPRSTISKAAYEETRLIAQWLQNRRADQGAVIPLANHSAESVFSTLLLALSPELHYETELDAIEENWQWEQDQKA